MSWEKLVPESLRVFCIAMAVNNSLPISLEPVFPPSTAYSEAVGFDKLTKQSKIQLCSPFDWGAVRRTRLV